MAQIDIDEQIERFKQSAEFAQVQTDEEEVILRFQPIFTPENIDNLTGIISTGGVFIGMVGI